MNILYVFTFPFSFVIASQAAYDPKMIEMVGRVIVEFDFAIVEPYILEDGTVDTSRIHLEMGISTYTPISNNSLLVFMGKDFLYYIADTPGNVLTEVLKMVRHSNLPCLYGQGVEFKHTAVLNQKIFMQTSMQNALG